MKRLRPLHRHAGRPLWWLGLLLGVWLAAQTLALAHREVHSGAGDRFHAGHAAADCQLYDHAGAADLLAPMPLLALAVFGAPMPRVLLGRARHAPAAPPFLARGPPALR